MSNKVRAERRSRSWAKGVKRRAEKQAKQEEAHQRNLESGTSPWAAAKTKRRLSRIGLQR